MPTTCAEPTNCAATPVRSDSLDAHADSSHSSGKRLLSNRCDGAAVPNAHQFNRDRPLAGAVADNGGHERPTRLRDRCLTRAGWIVYSIAQGDPERWFLNARGLGWRERRVAPPAFPFYVPPAVAA